MDASNPLTRRRAVLLSAAGALALFTGFVRAGETHAEPSGGAPAPAKPSGSGAVPDRAAPKKAPAGTWEKVDGVSSASERRRARKERREKKKARRAAQGA